MANMTHILITEGPASGREIEVTEEGVRIGRSSKNDLSIADDAMSRFQCRFFMKPGEGLWVSDLGSINGTLVNGSMVQEQRLKLHDEVLVGNTRLRVVNTGDAGQERVEQAVAPDAPVPPSAKPPSIPAGVVDLGLDKHSRPTEAGSGLRRKLLYVAALMLVAVVVVWLPKGPLAGWFRPAPPPVVPGPAEVLPDLELSFEHVDGTVSNIFRYLLDIRGGSLVVQVDDLLNNRHVRKEKKVAGDLVRDLARSLQSSGVFDLREEYSGLAPGIVESYDLVVVVGNQAHHTRILNHVQPDEFAAARNMIEVFGKNELGLAALAVDPATLVESARAALLQARKLREEQEVREDNLFRAIRAYKDVELYMETIEPKPDFYGEALSGRSDCERNLQKRYDDLWFVAERAVKLRDWKEADRQLKVVCEMIPDRSDERNQLASRTLLDVQRHLTTDK